MSGVVWGPGNVIFTIYLTNLVHGADVGAGQCNYKRQCVPRTVGLGNAFWHTCAKTRIPM